MATFKTNQYPGRCVRCDHEVEAGAGYVERDPYGRWNVAHADTETCETVRRVAAAQRKADLDAAVRPVAEAKAVATQMVESADDPYALVADVAADTLAPLLRGVTAWHEPLRWYEHPSSSMRLLHEVIGRRHSYFDATLNRRGDITSPAWWVPYVVAETLALLHARNTDLLRTWAWALRVGMPLDAAPETVAAAADAWTEDHRARRTAAARTRAESVGDYDPALGTGLGHIQMAWDGKENDDLNGQPVLRFGYGRDEIWVRDELDDRFLDVRSRDRRGIAALPEHPTELRIGITGGDERIRLWWDPTRGAVEVPDEEAPANDEDEE